MTYGRTIQGLKIGFVSGAALLFASGVFGFGREQNLPRLGDSELSLSRGGNPATNMVDKACDTVSGLPPCTQGVGPCETCPRTYPVQGTLMGQYKPPLTGSTGDCGYVSMGSCVASGRQFICKSSSSTLSHCTDPPGALPVQIQ